MATIFSRLEEPQNRIKVSAEIKIVESPHSKRRKMFQLFFLMNDDAQGVEVVETPEIDLEEIIAHLRLGGSIFITNKCWSEV